MQGMLLFPSTVFLSGTWARFSSTLPVLVMFIACIIVRAGIIVRVKQCRGRGFYKHPLVVQKQSQK